MHKTTNFTLRHNKDRHIICIRIYKDLSHQVFFFVPSVGSSWFRVALYQSISCNGEVFSKV